MAGLEYKYDVKKNSDPHGKHRNCRYFVLDPQHDELARAAIEFYALNTENDELANGLHAWLDRLDENGNSTD